MHRYRYSRMYLHNANVSLPCVRCVCMIIDKHVSQPSGVAVLNIDLIFHTYMTHAQMNINKHKCMTHVHIRALMHTRTLSQRGMTCVYTYTDTMDINPCAQTA